MVVLIAQLPEELLLRIVEWLDDGSSPSERNFRDEPSFDLTASPCHPLKVASCVSKQWRRIVLPRLFKYARLRAGSGEQRHWDLCEQCQFRPHYLEEIPGPINRFHLGLVDTTAAGIGYPPPPPPIPRWMQDWFRGLYHAQADFLTFVRKANLRKSIRSIVVISAYISSVDPHLQPLRLCDNYRLLVVADFWQRMFDDLDPRRVVIVASPLDVAYLTHACIAISRDWSSDNMPLQMLELRDGHSNGHTRETWRSKWAEAKVPEERTFARSSIVRTRQWEHIALNDGAFLQAYSSRDFFDWGPPSIVSSLMTCFLAECEAQAHGEPCTAVAALRSFTYTAIFPFPSRANFSLLLDHVEVLDVQIAPLLTSKILDSRERTARVDLGDCWKEMRTVYGVLVAQMGIADLDCGYYPRLRKVICRDYQMRAIRDMDRVLPPFSSSVWVESKPGEFTRRTNADMSII